MSPDIRLIVECCKKEQNKIEIKNCISKINDWSFFINLSFSHGIFPLVYHTLKQYQELIPSDIIESMKSNNMDIVKQNMLMTSELIKVMKLLEENGIEAISFKGPVLSQMAYGDIVSRQYVDLDILVHEKDIELCVKTLRSLGYSYEEDVYRQISKDKSLFHDIEFRNKNGVSIELHWKLFSNEYNTNLEKINIRKDLYKVDFFNYKINSFSPEVLILYLCVHGAKHNWERIEWLLDINKYILVNYINWEKLILLSKKVKTDKIVFSTFQLCFRILNMPLPLKIRERIDSDIRILSLSKNFEELFYKRFKNNLLQKVESKSISKVQFDLLDGFKAKSLFIISILKPTQAEFKIINLKKGFYFIYYIIRPFNVITRWIKKI